MTLPPALEAGLRELGVAPAPKAKPPAPSQAWKPTYPGEEPPF